MADDRKLRELVEMRIKDLLREEDTIRGRLIPYHLFSQVAVVLGIVVPLLAGSALLTPLQAQSPDVKLWIGGFALLAAVLTAIHKGLNCETYQAQARVTSHRLRSLVEGFERTRALDPAALVAALEVLERRLEDLRASAFEIPPRRAIAD